MSGISAEQVKALLATPEPPELGPGPRKGVQSRQAVDVAIGTALSGAQLTGETRELLRALVLLWHDHLDEAHRIAQEVDSADGSLVHAVMHRREPDYWNSKYWFRRVGKHPCFGNLASRVASLLKARGEPALLDKLIPQGKWDPFAFVDACEAAAHGGSSKQQSLLREIQQIEFEVLLAHFVGSEAR